MHFFLSYYLLHEAPVDMRLFPLFLSLYLSCPSSAWLVYIPGLSVKLCPDPNLAQPPRLPRVVDSKAWIIPKQGDLKPL